MRAFGLYRHGGDADAVRQRLREALPLQPVLHEAIMSRALPPPVEDDHKTQCPTCGSRDLRAYWCPSRAAPEMQAA